MKIKLNEKRFFKQLIYYLNSFYSKQNIKKFSPLAGFSFDAIHHHVNIFGAYELQELLVIKEFLKQNLKSRCLALDVGANIGNHTVRLFSEMFDNVFCFEPNPGVFSMLNFNVQNHPNVYCYQFALSNEDSLLKMEINNTNLGSSSIVFDNSKNMLSTNLIEVESHMLDQLDIIRDKKVDLIKVDIEGHEHAFFQGAKKTINRDRPIILFEESHVDNSGSSIVIDYLKEMGYEFFIMKESFNLGDGQMKRLLRYFMQDLFGNKVSLIKTNKFKPGFYHLIIAQHRN